MEERKKDHIALTFQSQMSGIGNDPRFSYEPLLAVYPNTMSIPFSFLGKTLSVPFWISSMTGGTAQAKNINHNLARVAGEFGMGMGLGSCRILLDNPEYLPDFDVREIVGNELPLYANIGICQLEELVRANDVDRITAIVKQLRADGLIVHVNPLQEWFQPEGDRIAVPPIKTIEKLLSIVDYPIVVKEVGQGMGFESMTELLKLPLAAVEFAAYGGTNFSKMEMLRSKSPEDEVYAGFTMVGHTALEMVEMANDIASNGSISCRQLIISGGIKNFLDGYYLLSKSNIPAAVGMASSFLKYAHDYDLLRRYVMAQIRGFRMAQAYLRVKE